jgi:hypothetical protein
MANLFSMSSVIEGIESLVGRLTALIAKSKNEDQGSYIAGFSAPYATAVHNSGAAFRDGQAGFLKDVVDDMTDELKSDIQSDVKGGLSVRLACERAAVAVMKQAQARAPADTGTLRDSAFVEDDRGNLIAGTHLTAAQAVELRKFRARQNKGR